VNKAEEVTIQRVEAAFQGNAAFRQLDKKAFVVKQGSTLVMLHVSAIDEERAQVRCIAQLVKGVELTPELAYELLALNTRLRFGAFAVAAGRGLVLITHSLLGGETLDPEELASTISDLALVADQYDDEIIERFGGQRMQDLLEASEIGKLFDPDVDAFPER